MKVSVIFAFPILTVQLGDFWCFVFGFALGEDKLNTTQYAVKSHNFHHTAVVILGLYPLSPANSCSKALPSRRT